ncbi:hypothetical protein D9M68_603590 [compost metagenome]
MVRERLVEPFRHGAQVFADDERAVAPCLQRGQREQRLHRIAQVGAAGGRRAVRHQPQPRHAEDVVDAQAAGLRQRRAQHVDEGGVSAGGERARRKGGQTPVLPQRIMDVRRRADGDARHQVGLAAPCVAAVGAVADGEIGDQTNPHPGLAAGRVRGGKAFRGEPLRELMEVHLVGMLPGETPHAGRFRVPPLHRPLRPGRRIPAAHGMQGFEHRMVPQGRALFGAEPRVAFAQVGGRHGPELAMQRAQQALAVRARARPVYPAGAARTARLLDLGPAQRRRAQDGSRVRIERVQEQPAGRRVGAATAGLRSVHRVHRADGQRIRALRGGARGQFAQRAEIAECLVRPQASGAGRSPQAVDLRAQSPATGRGLSRQVGEARRPARRGGQHRGLAG